MTTPAAQHKNWVLAAVILFPLFLFVFLLVPYAMYHIFALLSFGGYSLTNAGQFGDSFGVLTCLFSGGAFAGVLYSIHLQRKEIKDNEDMHKLAIRMQQDQINQSIVDRRKSDLERRGEIQRNIQMHHDSIKMAALTALLPVYHGEGREAILSELKKAVGIKELE